MGLEGKYPINLWLLCGLSMIDGMDIQLLPSAFRALEADLGMSTTMLASLVVCRALAFAVTGPFWGNLIDNGYPRKYMLCPCLLCWGFCTIVFALVSDFHVMAVLRVLNGASLGLLLPITQSIVSDTSALRERGHNFGMVEFSNKALGQVFATLLVTSMSNMLTFGIAGWRTAFVGVGLLSLALAWACNIYMEENRPRPYTPENVGVVTELRKFFSYFKISTFTVIVVQGMFGTIPVAAMNFAPMYFQYLGLADWEAGAAFCMFVLGGGFGGLLGGAIGDKLAEFSENHGRPMTAQLSVFLGIPLVYLAFTVSPSAGKTVWIIGALMFALGLLSQWCAAGCNKPIFLQIVPLASQGSAMAWDGCVEQASGHIIGPMAVGLIAGNMLGYTTTLGQISTMDPEVSAENAAALGSALAFSTVLPWCICFLLYSLLHFTYKHDIRSEELLNRASSSQERYQPNPLTA